jgi:RND family efflux transporter MFP subunit
MNKTFSSQWLRIVCQQISGSDSAVFVMPDTERKEMRLMATWPEKIQNSDRLIRLAKLTIKKYRALCIPEKHEAGQLGFDFFSYRIPIEPGLYGVIVVKTKALPKEKHKAVLQNLKRSTLWLDVVDRNIQVDDKFYNSVVGLLASCVEQSAYPSTLLQMVSVLCEKFKCERVAFAEFRHHHCHVLALSNSAECDQRSNLIQQISSAMDEALEQDSIILFPEKNSTHIQRAHQELARKYGSGFLCTIPLEHDGSFFGAITLLSNELNAMDDNSIKLCQQFLSLMTPYLIQKREEEKSFTRKVFSAIGEGLQSFFGLRFLKLKLIVITVVSLIVCAGLIQSDYQITADAVLEGKIQRVIASPISGYLLAASVRAGDTVKKGDEMARLNDVDLILEKAKFTGHLQKLQREYRQAQSTRDLVKVRVIKEQIIQAKAEINFNDEQLAKTYLLAPFDGVVIEGDLQQMLGTPIERGDGLFKIAPLSGYRIILKVDESDIAQIKEGQQGGLLLSSLPNTKLQLNVAKITAVSKINSGANIFRVEASLQDPPDILRPGMEGLGKINAGRASLLWIWTRKIKNTINLWLWSWLP